MTVITLSFLPLLLRMLLFLFLQATTAELEWRQTNPLRDINGASGDYFGAAVAIDDGTLVVGAPASDRAANDAGAVSIFGLLDGVWMEQASITGSDAGPLARFGESVAVSSGIVAVGASGNSVDELLYVGAVYVYVQEADGSWTEEAKLITRGNTSDHFGYAISILGSTLIAGVVFDDDRGTNAGSVFVFSNEDGIWTQQAKLAPADTWEHDRFGHAVSVQGEWLIVGSPHHDNDASGGNLTINSGAAYLFQQSADGTWTEQAKLTPSDEGAGFKFGSSVSIFGDTVVVGSPYHNGQGAESGTAYLFKLVSGVWTEQTMLVGSETNEGDQFGLSVSISAGRLVVGAPFTGPGSAYFFTAESGSWTEQARFTASGTANQTREFGRSVAIDQDVVVIGAPGRDFKRGISYVFDISSTQTATPRTQPVKATPSPAALPTLLPTTFPSASPPSVLLTRGLIILGVFIAFIVFCMGGSAALLLMLCFRRWQMNRSDTNNADPRQGHSASSTCTGVPITSLNVPQDATSISNDTSLEDGRPAVNDHEGSSQSVSISQDQETVSRASGPCVPGSVYSATLSHE